MDRRQRRGIRLGHEPNLFTYLSSHYQFFIILTVLGIYMGSGGKLKEKDKQGADSHTSSIIITASSCEIFSVLKFLVFLENMVLGGTLNSTILRIRTIVLQRNLQPTCRTSAQQILTLGKASSS